MAIITIDGNIGCGKSSVMSYIHSKYGTQIDLEPVAKWQPYLTEMYENKKSGFEFQVRVWLDRCWIQQLPYQSTILMERSPYFQGNVFVPAMLSNGSVTDREHGKLQEMYQHTMHAWSPSIYIYLRSDPDRCSERILERNRASEDAIPQAYLDNLHYLHEQAYVKAYMKCMPVICVDVENKSIEHIGDEVHDILKLSGSF